MKKHAVGFFIILAGLFCMATAMVYTQDKPEFVIQKEARLFSYSIALSMDGKTIVSGNSENTVSLWDTESGQILNILRGHTDVVCGVAISGDGKTIVSGSNDKTVQVWDKESGLQLWVLKGHKNFVCYSFLACPLCQASCLRFFSLELTMFGLQKICGQSNNKKRD